MDNIKETKKTKGKVNSRKSILDIVYIALLQLLYRYVRLFQFQ